MMRLVVMTAALLLSGCSSQPCVLPGLDGGCPQPSETCGTARETGACSTRGETCGCCVGTSSCNVLTCTSDLDGGSVWQAFVGPSPALCR